MQPAKAAGPPKRSRWRCTMTTRALPIVIGMVTPSIMGGVKKVARFVDKQPAPLQQMGVAGIAWGMTALSTTLGTFLPSDLSLVTDNEMSAALSAGIAFALHAAKKGRGESKPALA